MLWMPGNPIKICQQAKFEVMPGSCYDGTHATGVWHDLKHAQQIYYMITKQGE